MRLPYGASHPVADVARLCHPYLHTMAAGETCVRLPVKGTDPMTFLDRIIRAARKQVAYLRTRDALARLLLDTQLDLGIYAGDSPLIARRAVFG